MKNSSLLIDGFTFLNFKLMSGEEGFKCVLFNPSLQGEYKVRFLIAIMPVIMACISKGRRG